MLNRRRRSAVPIFFFMIYPTNPFFSNSTVFEVIRELQLQKKKSHPQGDGFFFFT